jgi:SHS2 domain-containing protein
MSTGEAPPPYEILEHTADIGLRAFGQSLEELFANAAWGLAEILDVNRSERDGQGRRVAAGAATSRRRASGGGGVNSRLVDLRGSSDVEALLVDWMNELIVFTEEGKACIADIDVETVNDQRMKALMQLVDCQEAPEGTDLKAATYHQLSVRQRGHRWEATMYFDV